MSKDKLQRALGYPYPIPGASYIVEDGETRPLAAAEAARHRAGRTGVLAVGSNQSPAQIARKYQGGGWGPVPCEKCRVIGFDTVFSAHITAYGSIAATLHPSPGTTVDLIVNWLDQRQLERMHETELPNENYTFARLEGIELVTELGIKLDSIHFYNGRRGAFVPDGQPIPFAAVAAEGRRWQAATQHAMQDVIRRMTDPGQTLEDFILSSIDGLETRRQRTEILAETSAPFEYPGLRILRS